MKDSRLMGAVSACLLTFFSASSEAVIVGFDSLEVADSDTYFINPGIYSEGGYTITGDPMTYHGQYDEDNYAGSAGLNLQAANATVTLQHSAGNLFSIESIGLSFFRDVGTSPLVSFTGYVSGGGTVTQSFQPSTFGFTDFFFNSSFTDLTSLSWNQGTNGANSHQFDNIALSLSASTSAVVPIPATVWLFGSGLLGLIGMARQRTAA